tara:strand:+ start:64 stop:432 length:369 start_codon:yes stop_codon:yes gene_type:complete
MLVLMIFISWVYGIYSIFKAFGLYGFWALFLIPLWFVFTYFTGIPGIINLLRTLKYWSKKEVVQGLAANIISASILFLILEFTNAQEIQSNFFLGGIITAFSMPQASLVSERNDALKTQEKL